MRRLDWRLCFTSSVESGRSPLQVNFVFTFTFYYLCKALGHLQPVKAATMPWIVGIIVAWCDEQEYTM